MSSSVARVRPVPQVPASVYYVLPRAAERVRLIHPDAGWIAVFACLAPRGPVDIRECRGARSYVAAVRFGHGDLAQTGVDHLILRALGARRPWALEPDLAGAPRFRLACRGANTEPGIARRAGSGPIPQPIHRSGSPCLAAGLPVAGFPLFAPGTLCGAGPDLPVFFHEFRGGGAVRRQPGPERAPAVGPVCYIRRRAERPVVARLVRRPSGVGRLAAAQARGLRGCRSAAVRKRRCAGNGAGRWSAAALARVPVARRRAMSVT